MYQFLTREAARAWADTFGVSYHLAPARGYWVVRWHYPD